MEPDKLSYFIAEKQPLVIVSFVGCLTNENIGVVDHCAKEIFEKSPKFVILNFRDVTQQLGRVLNLARRV